MNLAILCAQPCGVVYNVIMERIYLDFCGNFIFASWFITHEYRCQCLFKTFLRFGGYLNRILRFRNYSNCFDSSTDYIYKS